MEFFLVFLLGIALALVVLYVLRPGLFSRSTPDFSLYEVMFEEALAELEKRQKEFFAVIEEKEEALIALQQKIMATFVPSPVQSPKISAVLDLAGKGLTTADIAKKLGLGVGEVQLILELNRDK